MNINDKDEHTSHHQDPEEGLSNATDVVVAEMIQQADQEFADMTDEQIDALHKEIMQRRVYCYDPENYPPEVLEVFEGQYTVPFYLVAERNRKRLEEKRKQYEAQQQENKRSES